MRSSTRLRLDDRTVVRCNYPFHRMTTEFDRTGRSEALIGFNACCPSGSGLTPTRLTFVVLVAADDASPGRSTITLDRETGHTREIHLDENARWRRPGITALESGRSARC